MKKGLCYMVRPAHDGQNWEEIFSFLVEPAAIAAGFTECRLGAAMGVTGSPIEDIVAPLVDAELVVADVSGEIDPTVYYLIGVRHARANGTILITQDVDRILHDFKPFHVIPYNTAGLNAVTQFKDRFDQILQRIRAEPDRPDNPVLRHIQRDVEWREITQRQQERIDELERRLQAREGAGQRQTDNRPGRSPIRFKKVN